MKYIVDFTNKKIGALLLLCAAFALLYAPLLKFPFKFVVISIYVLAVSWLQQQSLHPLGFKKFGIRELKLVVISYTILELSMDFIVQPLVNHLFNEPADYSSFYFLEGNTHLYIQWLLSMWISAAIGEELLFRGFVFQQLDKVFAGKHKIIQMIVSAFLFALPHLYQGLSGLVMTFLFGLAFGTLFLKFRNLWINILVHGLIDTVFLTLSYYGLINFYSL